MLYWIYRKNGFWKVGSNNYVSITFSLENLLMDGFGGFLYKVENSKFNDLEFAFICKKGSPIYELLKRTLCWGFFLLEWSDYCSLDIESLTLWILSICKFLTTRICAILIGNIFENLVELPFLFERYLIVYLVTYSNCNTIQNSFWCISKIIWSRKLR